MKYESMNKQIIAAVGTADNIQSVVHCATRLRFVLKDEGKADDKKAEAIPGVMQVVKRGGQYQLVIGSEVEDVYNELIKMIHVDNTSNSNVPKKKTNIFDAVISAITGSIAPAIPLLAGAGMGKVLLLILTMTGILTDKSQTYQMLNLIFDTGYFFIPAYVGFSAAKVFNTDQYLGAFLGLVTVNPNWTALVTANKPVQFLGMNVPLIKYSSTLITAIMSVWVMSYIYKFIKRWTPKIVKIFMVPMLTMLITAPLTFLLLGPISNWISEGIAWLSMWLFHNAGIIAIPLLAAAYPWLVSIGVHKALSPISIQLVATQGYDPIIRVVALCSNMSQAAASLAVGLKTKNKNLKGLALSSSATAYLGGITEPALFGVNLPLKKPMYGAMIGGAIAGVVASFLKMKAFIYVTPALLSLPMWVGKAENFVIQAVIVIVVASIATFIATWIIGFDDPVDEDTKKENKLPQAQPASLERGKEHEIKSPVKGKLESLEDVNDETFASGVMGKGIAVIPSEGKITAPADGIVTATFDSSHAIGLHLDNNADVLIHIGIDTVEMKGEGFKQLVKKGDHVKAGQELVDFDISKIKSAGYDPTVIMIVLNTQDFLKVVPVIEDKDQKKDVTDDDNVLIIA
ncbi:PTS system beta-glucosides-specific IIC component [Lactobacillus colini]|uniref:PTS system beta-glucosides-specific IIC component n=1 Tax=Lactobacillus colini TaxID=1819254 RepID=A0ABS4MF29_9LACO|nr:PTS beta-glucoside transporter subunit IIBCA [Lactobacillus colini]MBP2058300.1 PTS system beta-glucosides-specific IIC component [Lactobacillus colini]